MQAVGPKTRYIFFYCIIAVIYSLFLSGIIRITGIVTINEAEKYIFAAENILSGNFTETIRTYLFYSGYISFLSLILLVGNIKMAIVIQAALSFTAGICIKKILDNLQQFQLFSFAGMLLFLFCYPIQVWTVTLFSESFFISISTITLYYTVKEKSKAEYVLWACLIFLLLTTRPPGVFLVLPFIIFVLWRKKILTNKASFFIYISLFIGLTLSIFLIPVENKGYIQPIAAGRIIVDSTSYHVPGFSTAEKSTMASAYYFLGNQKGTLYLCKLYLKKVISFFTLTRPYYSRFHNMAVRLFYIFYPLAVLGMLVLIKKNKKDIVLLFAVCCFGIVNLVACTFNEWHYRFTVTIFPFLIILAICSISEVYTVYFRLKRSTPKNERQIY